MKNLLKNIGLVFEAIAAGCVCVGVVLIPFALAAAFALFFAWVPWLLYNYAVAPVFEWPQCGFWKFFFLLWAINWLHNFLFRRKSE